MAGATLPRGTGRPRRTVWSAAAYTLAATLALCGVGLIVGLDSPFVPAVARPVVGAVFLALSVRMAWRVRGRPLRRRA